MILLEIVIALFSCLSSRVYFPEFTSFYTEINLKFANIIGSICPKIGIKWLDRIPIENILEKPLGP
jgi:hypothetical protein